MNNINVRNFYENGEFTIDVQYKAIPGCTVMCIENGVWYKFKVDSVEELDNEKYRITTSSLIGIDDKLIIN
jgi:hypothetical protein